MGALGSIVASRIAREFRLGGPSFTVSSEETSGLRALDLACGLLRRGELDEALVGAVDFPSDPRAVQTNARFAPGTNGGDGGSVLVLKRLADAETAGDRVLAEIRGVGFGAASFVELDPWLLWPSIPPALDQAGFFAPDLDLIAGFSYPPIPLEHLGKKLVPIVLGGNSISLQGSGAGLAALVGTILGLAEQVVPRVLFWANADGPWSIPQVRETQFALRNRTDGPRLALVVSQAVDGNCAHAVLASHPDLAARVGPATPSPLGDRPAGLFACVGEDADDLLDCLERLEMLIETEPEWVVEALARAWFHGSPPDPLDPIAVAIVATDRPDLTRQIAAARRRLLAEPESTDALEWPGESVALNLDPVGTEAGLAFVFPAMGNGFVGMGRELTVHWPHVLRRQDQENLLLRSQMEPGVFWNADMPERFDDHRAPIFGQVTIGTVVADLLRSFGVQPTASIGYSLGESTALFGLRAWTDRDAMYRKFAGSSPVRHRPRRALRRRPSDLGADRGRGGRLGGRDRPGFARAGHRSDGRGRTGVPPAGQHR